MRRMSNGLTIGGLAQRSQVSRDTLRFYERRRLLSAPRRSPSGYRLYTEDDADRVRFIRRAQAMGLTLEDIQELLRAQTLKTADQCQRLITLRGDEDQPGRVGRRSRLGWIIARVCSGSQHVGRHRTETARQIDEIGFVLVRVSASRRRRAQSPRGTPRTRSP